MDDGMFGYHDFGKWTLNSFDWTVERAPLLSDAGEHAQATNPTSPSVTERISSIAQEPLTPLTQILLILVLVLLLTTSVRDGSLFLDFYLQK